jgi:protein-tyrosine phosphatase
MAAAARAYGITLRGRARQFQVADFEQFDWILVMDRQNFQDIQALDRDRRYGHKLRLVCDYCRTYPDQEVPDPYYGGPEGFTYVIDLLTDACNGFLDQVIAAEAPPALPDCP